jgi:Tfp pilus assembly protein PilZ
MPAERHFRAFARRAVDLPAVVTTASGSVRPARLVDLGLGGARIEVAAAVDVGSPVRLQVTAPNLWDPLVVTAKVAWCQSTAPALSVVGLAFTHEEDAALSSLVELLFAQRAE